MTERRRHIRYAIPLDGRWQGASGASTCRIADISLGGCFIQSRAAPVTGERTRITISCGNDKTQSLDGRVVYVERGMGFAVEFVENSADAIATLHEFIDELAKRKASA